MPQDTNAQENIGKQFQQLLLPKRRISLKETIRHIHRFCQQLQTDQKWYWLGIKLPMGFSRKAKQQSLPPKRRIGKAYFNDGRPPDTTEKLIPMSKLEPT